MPSAGLLDDERAVTAVEYMFILAAVLTMVGVVAYIIKITVMGPGANMYNEELHRALNTGN